MISKDEGDKVRFIKDGINLGQYQNSNERR
jgi:hypothetical protein